MEDSTIFLVLGLCGLGVVIVGIIAFVFSIVFRFTGRNFMGFLTVLARSPKDEEETPSFARRHRPNLRAIVNSQDFDAALAKHVVQDEGVITDTELRAQNNGFPSSPILDDVEQRLGNRRGRTDDARRKRRRDGDTEAFGAFLNDDDDADF